MAMRLQTCGCRPCREAIDGTTSLVQVITVDGKVYTGEFKGSGIDLVMKMYPENRLTEGDFNP